MGPYESGLLNAFYANDSIFSPVSSLHLKENLLGGTSLSDGNGNIIFETTPSAAGGETVMFANGETGHLTENIYGSTTLDMQGIENDIVGHPSIFGGESFYQGGEYVGSIEPNFMGNGFNATGSTGETLFTTSPDITGGTSLDFTSPLLDHGSSWHAADLQNSFSEIETISSQVSVADLGSASDAVDGLDFLDFF
ncbi:hypothetical protein [Bacillus infantis]|jgi:hypothetical protein|uniref:hypothetical protein n=1 Tax=Bacillus infantis TaxID=324767 RepID=UPI002155F221|nr:hypothetical protein [Bacillus infantis]MCR6609451.1 hypothetical protein [Bacillus infantis]